MTKKMLIDASHAEETRVVVLDGNRLEDFDVETAGRKQIKGNIYLAKVIRVEPSLQAAFVEYGGNRHGFLAFGEIHPDYYQIPVADRQKLLALQAEEEERAAQLAEEEETSPPAAEDSAAPEVRTQALDIKPIEIVAAPPPADEEVPEGEILDETPGIAEALNAPASAEIAPDAEAPADAEPPSAQAETEQLANMETADTSDIVETITPEGEAEAEAEPEVPPPEQIGGDGDDAAEARERRLRQRFLRNYKIQDVIHRRQIMLVQVVKEERGNKGAALTTYLSLAGRFSVLMPNSPTGGGVSRKITSQTDRRRLKEAMAELDVPQGMGLIVRTAGANRPKPEIKRDCEYLLRLWDDIRDKTMESTAPALIYEEANLIKRAIRDVYTRDVEDILVDGQDGYRAARDFMRMLMPAQARKVQLWGDGQPLFGKYQVEAQLDAMLSPVVQLRSGGYIVINQTEALVAIDVNSGRSTRERSIEDTALRTNLEAAEEVAKQLRMRDLAGLIVIDFIDMESRKNNQAVERRLKEALKHDRARIQVGGISHFGLLEMSRQRLRPSLTEASLIPCPHCAGMGHVRSPESAALHILRAIEDEGAKFRAAEIAVALPPEIAFYLFNHKRERLSAIEARYAMRVIFNPDSALTGTNFKIERIRAQTAPPPAPAQPERPERPAEKPAIAAPEAPPAEAPETAVVEDEDEGKAEAGDRKRRRRRRGKRRSESNGVDGGESAAEDELPPDMPVDAGQPSEIDLVLEAALGAAAEAAEALAAASPVAEPPADAAPADETAADATPADATPTDETPAPKRRRTRTPRRRATAKDAPPTEATTPVYADIADIFEAAERAEAEARAQQQSAPPAAAAEPAPEPVSEPAAEPPLAASATTEPAIKPIVLGADDAPAEKKRGWWRR